MKVVLLAPVPPPSGGIASWTVRMMGASLKNNWKVIVVNERAIGGRTNFGSTAKKRFVIEIIRCFKIWTELVKTLHKNKDARIVQACVPAGTTSLMRELISCFITHLYGRKFIMHFRCTIPNMVKSNLNKKIFKWIINVSDCNFVLNKQSACFMKACSSKANFRIIPNFVNIDELEERKDVRDQIHTVLYVGGVIPEKGCEQIISVAKKVPTIEFRLVGKIGLNVLNVPENVVLCGELSKQEVQKELKKADVFLFLSYFWGEGFSNALAEAMANSLPCIVSDWAANADMIGEDGGIVIDSKDDQEVIRALEKLQPASIRKEMGEKNREKVKKYYLQEVITEQYVNVYEELLNI